MYILGINCFFHDSSACLLKDEVLIFAIAEERLSRIKHDRSFPVRSIRECLKFENIRLEDLDYICFSWNIPIKTGLHNVKTFLLNQRPLTKSHIYATLLQFTKDIESWGGRRSLFSEFGKVDKKRIIFVDHHESHALSAFAPSGFDSSNILVVDGRGATQATTLGYADKRKYEVVDEALFPNSLGLFYAIFTKYLGFEPNSDEWKVMGLAPYGTPLNDLLDGLVTANKNLYQINSRYLFGRFPGDMGPLEEKLGQCRNPESEITERHKNIAATVQNTLEEILFSLVSRMIDITGSRNLCLGGGVALNATANGKLIRSGLISNIFIQPAASDDGSAIGAAYGAYWKLEGEIPAIKMRDVYLGSGFSESQVEEKLKRYNIRYEYHNNIEEVVADLIASGNIIGWFQGRSEFGPRALGNRSILADPRVEAMKDKVNSCVKFRENWRPFAPAILEDSAEDYLEFYYPSPFMTMTFQVKEDMRKKIPAVVHIDGSTRPQAVNKEANPKFWRLIKNFESITGIPVILNTSFNLRGEPIVCTPEDAIRTFYTSGLDYLAMENFLIKK